jgi:hypothetical protein
MLQYDNGVLALLAIRKRKEKVSVPRPIAPDFILPSSFLILPSRHGTGSSSKISWLTGLRILSFEFLVQAAPTQN